MASLKEIAKDYRDEIIDGIAWVTIWKNGRSWNASAVWPEDGGYDEGYILHRDDLAELKAISTLDHKAICINGYYMGFGEDFTLEDIANKILYFYEGRMNQLFGDFLQCFVQNG